MSTVSDNSKSLGPRPDDDPIGERRPAVRASRAAVAISILAFALRLGAIFALGDVLGFHAASRGGGLEWSFGYEQAAVAQSVAEGVGFADPFQKDTGATAWVAPAYPLILGGLIRLFGGLTVGVAWCLAILQLLAASLTCYYLWRLGRALHSHRAGLLAALFWALHPMAIYLPVALVWDSTLVALSITWFLTSMLERGPSASSRSVALLGLGFGLSLFVNPAPLALVPVIAWHYLQPRFKARRIETGGIRRVAILLGVALCSVSPWLVRNYAALGTPQIRSNLGVELFVGNNDGAIGPFNGRMHPAYNGEELAKYKELGEVAYAKDAGSRAVQWMREHPSRFLRLCLVRFQLFWLGPNPGDPIKLGTGLTRERDAMGWVKWLTHFGFGLLALAGAVTWKGRPGSRGVMRGTLFLFPLVYYVTHVFERYRFPIEPMVTLAAAVLVLRLVLGANSLVASSDQRAD